MASEDTVDTITLSGSDWYIHEDAAGAGAAASLHLADVPAPGWIPARVPGNIQSDLEAAHALKPLWYGAGDPRLHDVARRATGGIGGTSRFRTIWRASASNLYSTASITPAMSGSTASIWARMPACSGASALMSPISSSPASATVWR